MAPHRGAWSSDVGADDVAGVLVVEAIGDDELDLVPTESRIEIRPGCTQSDSPLPGHLTSTIRWTPAGTSAIEMCPPVSSSTV